MPNGIAELDAELDTELLAVADLDELLQRGADASSALAKVCSKYPAHAEFLADYALSMAAGEPLVAPALELLYDERIKAAKLDGIFSRLAEIGSDIDALCHKMRLGDTIISKLERRLIKFGTIPGQLISQLAGVLQVSGAALQAYLKLPPMLDPSLELKSKRKPTPPSIEEFNKAVTTSRALNEIDDDAAEFWKSQPVSE